MTKITKCTCHHEYQDKIYGRNNRLHNDAPKSNNGNGGWRCTICLAIKSKTTISAS